MSGQCQGAEYGCSGSETRGEDAAGEGPGQAGRDMSVCTLCLYVQKDLLCIQPSVCLFVLLFFIFSPFLSAVVQVGTLSTLLVLWTYKAG